MKRRKDKKQYFIYSLKIHIHFSRSSSENSRYYNGHFAFASETRNGWNGIRRHFAFASETRNGRNGHIGLFRNGHFTFASGDRRCHDNKLEHYFALVWVV